VLERLRIFGVDCQQGIDIPRIERIELPLDHAFRIGGVLHVPLASPSWGIRRRYDLTFSNCCQRGDHLVGGHFDMNA
jgi:hypothetical protein